MAGERGYFQKMIFIFLYRSCFFFRPLSPAKRGLSPLCGESLPFIYIFKILLFSMHKTIFFKVYGAIAFPEGKVGAKRSIEAYHNSVIRRLISKL